MPLPTSASALDAATPASRDRLIDLVRGASIVVVVLGHWTMAAFVRDLGGGVRLRNVLEVEAWAHPLTWVLQVMPLFFLAAGFTNHLALTRPRATVAAFIAGRVERVLRPTIVFGAIWLVGANIAIALGAPADLLTTGARAAAMVLWFLAVYVMITLLAPLQLRLHQRHPWLLLATLPVVTLLLDRLQGTSWALLGYLSYATVFIFCAELGYLYAEGRLAELSRRAWGAVAAGAIATLVLLTVVGPYPVSMIGLPGQTTSNMMPPSVCVIVVAILQTALVMIARPWLLRWLDRPRVWASVVAINVSVMTLFLWHLTALILVAAVALGPLKVALPLVGSGAWWIHKIGWIAASAALTFVLVAIFARAERLPARAAARPGILSGLGGLIAAIGLTMLACSGFVDPWTPGGIALGGGQFRPGVGALLVLLGWALTRWPTPPSSDLARH